MALVFSVRPLRKNGIRLTDPPQEAEGYFRVDKAKVHPELLLISHMGGITMLGPLYEPRLTRTEPQGFVLMGFEVGSDGAGVVQEWYCTASTSSFIRSWGVEPACAEKGEG